MRTTSSVLLIPRREKPAERWGSRSKDAWMNGRTPGRKGQGRSTDNCGRGSCTPALGAGQQRQSIEHQPARLMQTDIWSANSRASRDCSRKRFLSALDAGRRSKKGAAFVSDGGGTVRLESRDAGLTGYFCPLPVPRVDLLVGLSDDGDGGRVNGDLLLCLCELLVIFEIGRAHV